MQFIKTLSYLLPLLTTTFQRCYANANNNHLKDVKTLTSGTSGLPPTIFFLVTGNIYPDGYYYVTVNLGDPPKPYEFDIDTGSHLTWVQCDAPCQKCLRAPNPPYKPVTRTLVECEDPLCTAIQWPKTHHCESPDAQCDYYLKYVDGGSSLGIVIRDPFSLQYTNGTVIKPHLAFGCGYHQSHPNPTTRPYVDGILGLGMGKESILSQLQQLGIIKNVVGHCLSSQRNGYLFLGDEMIPEGVVWTPMVITDELPKRYYLGVAELYVAGVTTGKKDLRIVFDSASTYTFFTRETVNAMIHIHYPKTWLQLEEDIRDNFHAIDTVVDEEFPLSVCWRGSTPFRSNHELKHFFKPIVLSFENAQNSWFEMDPEAYLLITKQGNACLRIFYSDDIGDPAINLIGDISFVDKVIIYDNVNHRIGWGPADCNSI
uniref:aspartic proteinase Asp1-like n=1 Tax=Erigeron canadensis TaxID=72917 RepID=UPI001CB903DE|nr:aspartic proteinase Asp1-like [Erigeron canadensis]